VNTRLIIGCEHKVVQRYHRLSYHEFSEITSLEMQSLKINDEIKKPPPIADN
jgi:hypothetical protein